MVSTCPKLVKLVKPAASSKLGGFKRLKMEDFALKHKLLALGTATSSNVTRAGGKDSYAFIGSFALLERALLNWTMNELVTRHSFIPVVVPNILYSTIIEKSGFPTHSQRTQIFKIAGSWHEPALGTPNSLLASHKDKVHSCIAGTSEFALASLHIGDTIPVEQLPKRYCAQSRCYRAETSNISTEFGVFRVHYFNKVEMFGFTEPNKSDEMLNEFVGIQMQLFDKLELHYKLLEMPKEDLGLSASKKFDIEAYMEGRQLYGEISSASNCTDYQSSRLNIKCTKFVESNSGELQVEASNLHTVNGTACAATRMLIAIAEQHQTADGKLHIPNVLRDYMDGETEIPIKNDKLLETINFKEAAPKAA